VVHGVVSVTMSVLTCPGGEGFSGDLLNSGVGNTVSVSQSHGFSVGGDISIRHNCGVFAGLVMRVSSTCDGGEGLSCWHSLLGGICPTIWSSQSLSFSDGSSQFWEGLSGR